ncbi:MAG: riboflavin biosynthesis protein RibF [Holophagaceae bacterium]|nr:riboflavin biosynthesis protein RibF [Holophagaceae bacterium]
MEIWHHSLTSAPNFGPCLVTLGNFDGVHAGHRELLEQVHQRAEALGLPSAVVSFDPHPTVVTAPERRPRLLMTLGQRLKAFQRTGVDLAWIIPFSRALSEMAPEAFLAEFQRVLQPREVHVGKAFRFGKDQAGDLLSLTAWGEGVGCEVHAHALRAADGGFLSSTRIREALDKGNVEEAASLLGHPFALTGVVVEGDRRGRHLGFPTANLEWEQEQLPAKGVYVTEVRGSHLEKSFLGLTNVGDKPTFEGVALAVETHLPGFQGDLYGTHLELAFLHRLRGEHRFTSVDGLRAQIAEDVQRGQNWWREQKKG